MPADLKVVDFPSASLNVNVPGWRVVAIGAWFARTPRYPRVPGATIETTLASNKVPPLATTDAWNDLSILSACPALQLFSLLKYIFNRPYHVKSLLRDIIKSTFYYHLKTSYGIRKLNVFTFGSCECLCHKERL